MAEREEELREVSWKLEKMENKVQSGKRQQEHNMGPVIVNENKKLKQKLQDEEWVEEQTT